MIEPGDVVSTSYGTGPYLVVRVSDNENGTFNLVCEYWDRDRASNAYLNGIEQCGDRYFKTWNSYSESQIDQGDADEVIVEERGAVPRSTLPGAQRTLSFGGDSDG